MDRFYVEGNFELSPILKDKNEIEHLRKVLRYEEGDTVEVFDSEHREYLAEIKEISKHQVVFEIREIKEKRLEQLFRTTLYQGIAKGSRMEFVAQKSTELGIDFITPVRFERCVAKLEKQDKKIERWNKICLEAAKQSKRNTLCVFRQAVEFGEMLQELKEYDLVIFLYEEEKKRNLKQALQTWRREHEARIDKPVKIALIVGPEGGITNQETDSLKDSGVEPVTLGDFILRTETVGATVMAMLQYEFSNS